MKKLQRNQLPEWEDESRNETGANYVQPERPWRPWTLPQEHEEPLMSTKGESIVPIFEFYNDHESGCLLTLEVIFHSQNKIYCFLSHMKPM